MRLEQHFVTFSSPGTFFHEETTKPIKAWDPKAALGMSASVEERYGARPFMFQFTTRAREDDELDSKVVTKSPRYFMPGARIYTLEEAEARNDKGEEILRSNMRCNGWAHVIVTETPWRVSSHPMPGDVLLDEAGNARLGLPADATQKGGG